MLCKDCEFWRHQEANLGHCHRTTPAVVVLMDNMVQSMFPPTYDDDFCYEFSPRVPEPEEKRPYFLTSNFLEWAAHKFTQQFFTDLEPMNDGTGIRGKVEAMGCDITPEEIATFMEYFEQFFDEEDIDVSFS